MAIQESAGEQTPVQLVETTANFPPLTNQIGGQPPDKKAIKLGTITKGHDSRKKKLCLAIA